MKWVISDVHGCMNTLMALLEKLPKEAAPKDIIFVGDLIDRGPDSRKVINFVRDGGYDVVLGNHEELMIEAVADYINHNVEVEDNRVWMQNGGRACLTNYQESYGTDYDSLIEDTEWLRKLPTYLVFNENDLEGRKLVITHAVTIDTLDKFIDIDIQKSNLPQIEIESQINNMNELMLWDRTVPKVGSMKYFNISGHNIANLFAKKYRNKDNPLNENDFILDKDMGYACIDTGSFINKNEYGYNGKITCLSFPNFKVYQQTNIEQYEG